MVPRPPSANLFGSANFDPGIAAMTAFDQADAAMVRLLTEAERAEDSARRIHEALTAGRLSDAEHWAQVAGLHLDAAFAAELTMHRATTVVVAAGTASRERLRLLARLEARQAVSAAVEANTAALQALTTACIARMAAIVTSPMARRTAAMASRVTFRGGSRIAISSMRASWPSSERRRGRRSTS
jgi:hypothetical protein